MSTLSENTLRHWLALWRAPNIGPKQFAYLLENFQALDDLFTEPQNKLKHLGLEADTLAYLKNPPWQKIDQDCDWATKPNHHIICWQDPLYPKLLKQINDPPPLLFIQGDPKLLSRPQLAMVGSRSPTMTGNEIALQFAKELSLLGFVITSGLALGVDGASHQGALAGTGQTIAIMATGADIIYPKQHQSLATQISETGALVTEFPLGVTPHAKNFPRRNRIVSGLSVGTLVVEAGTRSGSLITARLAGEQGRDVFVIPGSIYNPNTRGCHQLIQQGAKLITCIDDISKELGPLIAFTQQHELKNNKDGAVDQNSLHQKTNRVFASPSKDSDEDLLLQCIDYEITTVDDMVRRSQLTAANISSILPKLELCGMVSALPGGYIRLNIESINTN